MNYMRITKQRRIILEELRRIDFHPTADELYELVRKRLPHLSLGTVYRNLELLSRLGEIKKIESCGLQMRFDGDMENHHHIRCVCCDRIDDLPFSPRITECDKEIFKKSGYRIMEKRIEFFGVCPDCRRKGEK